MGALIKYLYIYIRILDLWVKHGVNLIPELELMGNSNSKIGIGYLKQNGIAIDKFGIDVC